MSGLDWTRCPHCAQPLTREDATLRCEAGHSYDIARQGYVNLLGRSAPANADTAAMVQARDRFLGTGRYAPVAEAVADAAEGATRVLEVGAGTAWYLARVLDRFPLAEGLATDVSVPAARRAAKAHPRIASVVADTWAGLPLMDGCVDTVLCVFAPRNAAEFTRVLAPGGRLVVAVPGAGHLRELRERDALLGVADDKVDQVLASLPGWDEVSREDVTFPMALSGDEVHDLIGMGPNAFHGLPSAPAPIETRAAVTVVSLRRP